MSVTFALKWDLDRTTNQLIRVNNMPFGFPQARAVLRAALALPGGGSLRQWMDQHVARVINGPHRSNDGRLHMTVLCRNAQGGESCFHVYVSRQGNASGVEAEPTWKIKGHALDDPTAPAIANSAAL
ncbi:MAG: hypothetical protein J0L76_18405 [Rhodobacterales bacterium]|nr:hypothetical protein [Rhodobacterales bacterium]